MSELKTQNSPMPTRKVMAAIISGALMGALQSGLNVLWPDHPFELLMADFDIWIQTGVMTVAMYMTRERA